MLLLYLVNAGQCRLDELHLTLELAELAIQQRHLPSHGSVCGRRRPSAMGRVADDLCCARTKLVEEGDQLCHPKLNGLGEVALLPVSVHGLRITAGVRRR